MCNVEMEPTEKLIIGIIVLKNRNKQCISCKVSNTFDSDTPSFFFFESKLFPFFKLLAGFGDLIS